tara:strand:+ start:785 stop:1159 length:375 start_codon:yes stop_codon:yes gene_type:complete
MIQTVTEHDFINAFSPSDGFSYEGLKSLFQHFEWLENEWDVEPIELDVVAICSEYEEFENFDAVIDWYGKTIVSRNATVRNDGTFDSNVLKPLEIFHIKTIDDLREVTQVIAVGNTGRIIVRCF